MKNKKEHTQKSTEYWNRSLFKAITYRVIILILDFTVVYALTHKTTIALGFMIISNIYTTVIYYFHERIWSKIKWGRK